MSDKRSSWFPRAATAFALLSCYGTLLLVGLLSLIGISLTLDQGMWAGAVVLFAALAVVAIAVSGWRRRLAGPTLMAAFGFALILWVMLDSYNASVEGLGFAFLIAATTWDWWASKSSARKRGGDVAWIEASALAAKLAHDPRPIVVDVRGPDEFHGPTGHLPYARNIPLADIDARLPELVDAKDREVTLVCRTHMRSAKAAGTLQRAGFRDVRVLQGGMERWNALGLPVERPASET